MLEKSRQVRNRKTNNLEPLLKRRNPLNVVKTGDFSIFRDKFANHLVIEQVATGV